MDKTFILQLGKDNAVCKSVDEAKAFIRRFGHLTSAGEKRITALYNGTLRLSRDFAWMNAKHIPELKNYPEQACRMWVKPFTSHGGKRPGSGRPKSDTKQLNIRISNAALNKLSADAERQGITKAQVVERLILTN